MYPEPTELRLIGYLTEMNLDPKIQIKYVDTTTQLADILTEGNFTRDEWNHLLHLFNISNSSSASCPETMTKRMQEEKGEKIIVVMAKLTLNLVSQAVASSSTAPSSSASNRPGMLKASSQDLSLKAGAGRVAAEESKMTQRRVVKCGYQMQKRTTVPGDSLLQKQTRTWIFKQSARRLAAENPDIIDEDTEWPNHCRTSRDYVPHLQKVYSNLRQQLGRKPGDKMQDFDVNSLMWRMFMSVTLNAAVHRGTDDCST